MSTPGSRRRLPSARRCQAPGPVPPPRFLTALTACSIRRSRVCCTPLPARGSPRFLPCETRPVRRRACATRAFPAMRLHTPRRIPLVSSRTASPRPLPSCRPHPLHALPRPPRATTRSPTVETVCLHRPAPGDNRLARAHRGDSNRSRRPSGQPCSARPTLIPTPRPEPPKRLLAGDGDDPVASAARTLSPIGSRDTRRRDCSRWQQLAGFRTASTRLHRPSEEGRRGLSRAGTRERPGHRGVPARVVSPHRGGGVASGSMPREQRRTLSRW